MRHCLIVDSSPIIRKVAASILVGVGERAEEASSEAQAIAHCRIEMPDLILIDWKLKDGSALALLDQLMALTRLRKPHVVVLSTAHDPHIVEMALEA
ncbi:MAG: Response regulator MprA [Pseudomonadota bacterium]|jgi:two-component system chemotaxis response regulator CheY